MENLKIDPLNIEISSLSFKDYWGPDRDYVFEQYKNLPFAPFNKMEKIGKACDFTQMLSKPVTNQPSSVVQKPHEEETEFFVVESKSMPKNKTSAYPKKRLPHKPTTTNAASKAGPPQKNPYNNRPYSIKTKFKESMLVKSDWTLIHDITKAAAETMTAGVPKTEVITQTGVTREYDTSFDKIDPRNEKLISGKDGLWTSSYSTTSDNMFLEIIEKDTENKNLKEPVLYATDSILIALMSLKHSNFPWEIIVNKTDNFIVLDKPEKTGQSYIDLITINENTSGNLPEEEKDVLKLSLEATNANKSFINYVSSGKDFYLGEDNKANKIDKKLGYIYKRYNLDGKYQVVVRVEVDSYIKDPNSEKNNFCLVRALNENDLASEWRKKLISNKGAVFSSEMRNNNCKIYKWLCQAYLMEASTVKLGFVSRASQKESNKHVLLGVDSLTYREIATIMNFKILDCWILIKYLIEFLMKQENGKFALVKTPFKPQVRVYKVPDEKKEDL